MARGRGRPRGRWPRPRRRTRTRRGPGPGRGSACGPSLLLSPARRPSGTSTVAPAVTAPSGPGPTHQQVQHRDHQCHRCRQASRRYRTTPSARGGVRSTRCSGPRIGAIARAPTIDQLMAPSASLKGWWSTTSTMPTHHCDDVAADRDARAGGSRAGGHRAAPGGSGTRWPSPRRRPAWRRRGRCSSACMVSALRPAASATAATKASIAARRWNGDAFDSVRSRARVSTNPTSAHAMVRPNATAVTGAMPSGDGDAQTDHDPCDREPQDEDLEQTERAERRRRRCRRCHGGPVPHPELHLTADRHRNSPSLGLDGEGHVKRPRPLRPFRPACGRSGRPPTPHRHRGSRARSSAPRRAVG